MVVESLLAPEGYEVIRAMDGFEALEICVEQGMPDLMLLDIMMPGMSGYEVCRKLREMEGANCVPVVMVSAKVR